MAGINQSVSSYAFLKRDSERNRYQAQQSQTYNQVGKLLVTGGTTSDEHTFLVAFANIFVEEPTFTYGSVLDPASPAVPGSFPTVSATVIKWSTEQFGPAIMYQGAFMGIVTTGVPGQRIWVHYSFTGKAISFGLGQSAGNTTSTA